MPLNKLSLCFFFKKFLASVEKEKKLLSYSKRKGKRLKKKKKDLLGKKAKEFNYVNIFFEIFELHHLLIFA